MADPVREFKNDEKKQIFIEALYLSVLLLVFIALLVIVWWFPDLLNLDVASKSGSQLHEFALASLAGVLGGTTFAIKWLHHSVGSGPYDSETNKWGWKSRHLLWRAFVPGLSFIIAGAFYAVLRSGMLNIEVSADEEMGAQAFAVAFGFLAGYFSDRAGAKLKDVAYVLFGKTDDDEFERGT